MLIVDNQFLPLAERVAALRDPALRERILREHAELMAAVPEGLLRQLSGGFDVMFRLTDPVDYELDPSDSLAAAAARAGVDAAALAYDTLLEEDGRRLLYIPLFNYANHSFDDIAEMIRTPFALFGLSDAGAHCGAICDASMTTSTITVWARDRKHGERLPLEWLVRGYTQRTAAHLGWFDRGVLAPGYLADLNLIDYGRLSFDVPRMAYDLPAGGRRLVQRARGYVGTWVAGARTVDHDEFTGALPGRLLRAGR